MSEDDTEDRGLWSAEDLALWAEISQTVDPLTGKHAERKGVLSKPSARHRKSLENRDISQQDASLPVPEYNKLPYLKVGEVVGVDKSLANRVKEGKTPIDARLDLHGKTQEEAFESLRYFVATAHAVSRRTVLIITGKGAGVLRKEVPRWLNEPGMREYVLFFSYARPRHGGDGALYVLLRKNKRV